jgi:general secretion pathway protein J
MKHIQRGFTLLEVLIALALFSLLGMACYQLLKSMTHTEHRIHQHEQQLRALQRAISVLERDLEQSISYPVNGSSARQALIGNNSQIQLVRSARGSPLRQSLNELLLITHHWSNGQWIREYRSPMVEPQNPEDLKHQKLLEGVYLKGLLYIDTLGQRHPNWPADETALSLPQAIEIEIDAPGYPNVRRVIFLPGFKRHNNG